MPIYEYRCDACGHELEALQKMADAPLRECPECQESTLKRLVSAPAFRLKGGGWYETDFKSDKEKKRNLAEGSSDAPKSDKSGGDAAKASGDTKAGKESKAPKAEPVKASKSEPASA